MSRYQGGWGGGVGGDPLLPVGTTRGESQILGRMPRWVDRSFGVS